MSKKIDRQALLTAVESCTGLTESQRADLHQLLTETPKYGLVWEDTPEEVYEELKEEIPVMNEDRSKAIVNGNEYPNHVIIEGDNLHALTDLCYTHAGKIDVIYIDPPYNRGENDFAYNDDFIDPDDPFKHSLWLNFMSKRLAVAKSLLKDSGVLIVHIDEHEFDALNMLLENNIFNEGSNLGMIIWNKMNPKGDAQSVAYMHEYILLFCKNKDAFGATGDNLMREKPNARKIISKAKSLFSKIGRKAIPEDIKTILDMYNYPKEIDDQFKIEYTFDSIQDLFKAWLNKSSFSKGEKAYKYINKKGKVFRTVSMAWPNKKKAPDDYWIPIKHPITGEVCPLPSKGWRNPSATMKRLLGNEPPVIYKDMVIKGEIAFTKKKNGALNIPERVYFLEDNMLENVPSIYNDGSSSEQLFSDLGINFPYPKCMSVAKYLIKNVVRNNNATILDFFAGSGTTLHATMELNKEDGGHRQCILVTNNENKICEEVTYPRNKKVIEGYDTPKGEHVEGLHDNNLRYFKMDSVSRIPSIRNRRKLAAHMVDMLRIKHNIYTRKNQIGNYTIDTATMRYYEDNGRRLLIIMMPTEIYGVVEAIQALPPLNEKINVYVYSDGPYAYEDDFAAVADRVNVIALPGPMLKTFHRIAPKMNDVQVAEPDRELTEGEADDTSNDFNDGEE